MLTAADQAQVIHYWSEVCQLEHSSVASFARFTLEMMSLGAPADLLLATQEAAADEVRHAQLAAEILSALRGDLVGFGPLPLNHVKVSARRAEILERLIREACFGETLGVAEVTEQARLCDQPLIREHLLTVRDDETRHAGLAWRSLQWIIDSAKPEERAALVNLASATFAELSDEFKLDVQYSVTRPERSHPLNRFGVLTAAQTQKVRETAYYEVILPCLNQLGFALVA
jgi:hypothetical protein